MRSQSTWSVIGRVQEAMYKVVKSNGLADNTVSNESFMKEQATSLRDETPCQKKFGPGTASFDASDKRHHLDTGMSC